MPKVSVIIPCYNQGKYLNEAVESVLNQTYQDVEIIIVNDGSRDVFTNELLAKYDISKTKVITTKNNGVSSARNTGILNATGKYILPIDADDKIASTYIEKAVNILENNSNIGIVYCEAERFGFGIGKWAITEYRLAEILVANCIFCSGLFRKSDWEKVGGYKEDMREGLEDWEFWLSLIENGADVYKIPEVLFYYRQCENTRSNQVSGHQLTLYKKLMHYHPNLYIDNIEDIILPLCHRIIKLTSDKKFVFKINSKLGKKYKFNLLVQKNK